MCDVTRARQAKEVAHAKIRKHKKRDVFRDPQRVPFGKWALWENEGKGGG